MPSEKLPEAAVINFHRLNVAICEALGLNPRKIVSVTITLKPNDNSVRIESFVTNEEADSIATIIKQYRLVER